MDKTLNDVEPMLIKAALKEANLPEFNDLLEEIGTGNRLAPLVARRLLAASEANVELINLDETPLAIKGTEGLVLNFAKCCNPIPGRSEERRVGKECRSRWSSDA